MSYDPLHKVVVNQLFAVSLFMNLYVLLKMAPDTVEELSVAPDNRSLDSEYLRYKLSDSDEHALEEALILKETYGGKVTVAAIDAPELDDALFTALAKGADRAVKLGDAAAGGASYAAALLFTAFLKKEGLATSGDAVILLRSQAIDDLEGEIGPFIANLLSLPYLGVITSVKSAGGSLQVIKEFAGGLRGEFSMPMPAVLGIQSAEKAPRYVPIAKVRNVMKTAKIEAVEFPEVEPVYQAVISRMYKPEAAGKAQMIEGSPEEAVDRLIEILAKQSLI
jgi:electron transfer flavoprotein beta subunit